MFVLALVLLVGIVTGFVALLSILPVDEDLDGFALADIKNELQVSSGYQFYTKLVDQTEAPRPPSERDNTLRENTTVERAVITPATRVVPGNAQQITPRSLAAESYAEIPRSSLGQESYYLQAGNFREAVQAEQARAAVLLLGLDAFIVVRQDSNGARGHRVRIGPYFDQGKVTEAKNRLKKAGINYKLIRVTG